MSNIGLNKVILLGNAGQDAETKSLSGGKSFAKFSLAINQPFRNKKDGNQRVEWVRCVAWGKQAQIAQQFVAKGALLFVEGQLQTRKFEDREGGTKTVTEVVVALLRVLASAMTANHSVNSEASSAIDTENEAVPF